MSEQPGHGGEVGDQTGLPGEPGTPEGETGPSDLDPVTAVGEDAGDVGGGGGGGAAAGMSDALGDVAGGGEINDLGPTD